MQTDPTTAGMPPFVEDGWNSPEAVAAYLGDMSVNTLAQWRHKGEGPEFARMGKHARYHGRAVIEWAEGRVVRHPRRAA